MEQYISQTVTDMTAGYTIIYAAFAIVVFLFGLAFFLQVMQAYKMKANTRQFYFDNVIAFKVGYIHKHAADSNIELKYPPKSDLMQQLEEEVSKDLNTTS